VPRTIQQLRPTGRSANGGQASGFWRLVRWLLAGYLLVLVLLMFLEESLIFFPARFPEGDWEPPGLRFEDAWFQAADGTRLHGWYVPHSAPRARVLFCHGNAGNVSHRAGIVQMLQHHTGVAVLVFDYRGYGRSEGKPHEPGILADARAARAWLARRENIPESEIVLMGESLGGAVAVELAATDGARALILENTFSSLPDVAAHYYPWLPVRRLLRTRLDAAARIAAYHGPLLQSHGDADTIIPIEFGRRLFEAAHQPKQFLTLPGLDHNDPHPPSYYDALAAFLDRLPTR